jgi:mannose-6-phosphate isomerase-like protein (cupin superfamily)
MKKVEVGGRRRLFEPLVRSAAVQAATMTLKPGESSSERKENEHRRCEQWLLVLSGRGVARVGNRSAHLKKGTLLLIEKGEPHQITNTGKSWLFTINFYAPPAYSDDGDILNRASGR